MFDEYVCEEWLFPDTNHCIDIVRFHEQVEALGILRPVRYFRDPTYVERQKGVVSVLGVRGYCWRESAGS